jgi:tight adherence protein C
VIAGGEVDNQHSILYVLAPVALGLHAAEILGQQAACRSARRRSQGFPDALDMMLVCVEAGQSLDQSIMRVAKRIRRSATPRWRKSSRSSPTR